MLGFMPCDEQENPTVPNCNPISRWRASRSEPECDEKCFFSPERYSEYIYDVIFKPPHQKSITKSLLLLRESHTSSQKPRNRTSQPEICFLRNSTANVVEVVLVVIIIFFIIQIMLQLQFLSFEGNLRENVGGSNEGDPNINVVGIDQIGLIRNNENNPPTIAVVDDVNPHQGISD